MATNFGAINAAMQAPVTTGHADFWGVTGPPTPAHPMVYADGKVYAHQQSGYTIPLKRGAVFGHLRSRIGCGNFRRVQGEDTSLGRGAYYLIGWTMDPSYRETVYIAKGVEPSLQPVAPLRLNPFLPWNGAPPSSPGTVIPAPLTAASPFGTITQPFLPTTTAGSGQYITWPVSPTTTTAAPPAPAGGFRAMVRAMLGRTGP